MSLDYYLPPEPPAHVRFERMPQEQRPERSGVKTNQTPNTTSQSSLQQAIEAETSKTAKKHKPTYGPSKIGSITKSKVEAALAHSTDARDRQRSPESRKQSSKTTKPKQKTSLQTWKDLLRQKQYEKAIMAKKAQRTKRVDAEALIAQIHETIEVAQEIASFVPETQQDIAEMERRIAERKKTQAEAEYWENTKYEDPWEDFQLAELSELADLYRDMVAERTARAIKDEAEKAAHRKRQANPDGDKMIKELITSKLEKPFLIKKFGADKSSFTAEA